ncbi:MAG: hypothetical protein D3918_12940 [Candidatus Electrothrix sp. AX2]|nr:hypothetical protein [Candidatus Electrothrix gigas]
MLLIIFLILYYASFLRISLSYSSGLFFHLLIWPLSIALVFNAIQPYNNIAIYYSWIVFLLGILIGSFWKLNKKKTKRRKHIILSIDTLIYLLKILFIINISTFIINNFFYQQDISAFEGASFAAQSKGNIFLYVFNGMEKNFRSIIVLFLSWNKYKLESKQRVSALYLGILAPTVIAIINGYFYALNTSFLSYANKIFIPVILAFMMWNIHDFKIKNITAKTYFLIMIGVFLVSSIILFFGFDNILLKIKTRAEVYFFLNEEILKNIIYYYKYNFFYFFHSFLKVIGLSAYTAPMGTFILANTLNCSITNVIGGPNVHLPTVLFVLFGGGYLSLFLIFFVATLLGLIMRISVLKISESTNFTFSTYWLIWFWQSFPLLIVESSAWGHAFFFSTIASILLWFVVQLNPNSDLVKNRPISVYR